MPFWLIRSIAILLNTYKKEIKSNEVPMECLKEILPGMKGTGRRKRQKGINIVEHRDVMRKKYTQNEGLTMWLNERYASKFCRTMQIV